MTTLPNITHLIYRYRIFYDVSGNGEQDELMAHEYIVKRMSHYIQEYTIGTFLKVKFKGLIDEANQ